MRIVHLFLGLFLIVCVLLNAQVGAGRTQFPSTQVPAGGVQSSSAADSQAEEELQKGTALTRSGEFAEAIPHLLAARGRVANEYAAGFNLALCYVANGDSKKAIPLLTELRQAHEDAEVENLLAQAYIGTGQADEALAALQKAAKISPENEKLYLYMAEACTQHQDFALALKAVNIGLRNLPNSARLHYERGVILSDLDQSDRAKDDFAVVSKLAGDSEIGYISAAQQALFEGNPSAAVESARLGLGKGYQSPILLTILGQALLRAGAIAGQSDFTEAQSALERSVLLRPDDPSSQIALGQIYLAGGRVPDAIIHLEKARQMQPDRPAVYASLAKAYRRRGDEEAARQALATLEKLNLARAGQIRSAPGDRKMSYSGAEAQEK